MPLGAPRGSRGRQPSTTSSSPANSATRAETSLLRSTYRGWAELSWAPAASLSFLPPSPSSSCPQPPGAPAPASGGAAARAGRPRGRAAARLQLRHRCSPRGVGGGGRREQSPRRAPRGLPPGAGWRGGGCRRASASASPRGAQHASEPQPEPEPAPEPRPEPQPQPRPEPQVQRVERCERARREGPARGAGERPRLRRGEAAQRRATSFNGVSGSWVCRGKREEEKCTQKLEGLEMSSLSCSRRLSKGAFLFGLGPLSSRVALRCST